MDCVVCMGGTFACIYAEGGGGVVRNNSALNCGVNVTEGLCVVWSQIHG